MHLCMHVLTHTKNFHTHSCIHSLAHQPLIHSFTHSSIYALTLTYVPTHVLTHPLTHSLTHSPPCSRLGELDDQFQLSHEEYEAEKVYGSQHLSRATALLVATPYWGKDIDANAEISTPLFHFNLNITPLSSHERHTLALHQSDSSTDTTPPIRLKH